MAIVRVHRVVARDLDRVSRTLHISTEAASLILFRYKTYNGRPMKKCVWAKDMEEARTDYQSRRALREIENDAL